MRWLVCLLLIVGFAQQQLLCCCAHAEVRTAIPPQQPVIGGCSHHHTTHQHAEEQQPDKADSPSPLNAPAHEHHVCVGTHLFYLSGSVFQLPNRDLSPSWLTDVSVMLSQLDLDGWQATHPPQHGPPLVDDRSVLGVYLV